MRRRISTFAATAVLTGGVLLGSAPVQAVAAHAVTCKPAEMQRDIAKLKAKANRLKHEGEYAAAKRTRAQADAIQRKLNACVVGDRNSSRKF
ncbi:hypothetical protein I5Q34_28975 [Streptomyces sp. AV19]|uniref:hypothetical protein n=1 Tax=Streptomyces sp. AV19 TaxID=2793068 RepID=UPI0018FEA976|nr:hypothetical protein [Streptomyces sp. AV19]MBH1938245.1 hypothetical protein [Streptomyces sp. AV19]MDG4534875.1 hypothetical protein [Streptomyces sp. AV19]